jgi:hypothetical protein
VQLLNNIGIEDLRLKNEEWRMKIEDYKYRNVKLKFKKPVQK